MLPSKSKIRLEHTLPLQVRRVCQRSSPTAAVVVYFKVSSYKQHIGALLLMLVLVVIGTAGCTSSGFKQPDAPLVELD